MSEKTHWKEFFNYDYLGSHSLEEGEEKILTISSYKHEEVTGEGGKKDKCLVIYFSEVDKGMVMNATNSKTIQSIYESPYLQDWIGKQIQVYTKMVSAFGSKVPALRVRPMVPPNSDQQAKKAYYVKIRSALAGYAGDDKDQIRAMLNEKKKAGEDSINFLKNTLNNLSK